MATYIESISDHPNIHGEYPTFESKTESLMGSPPYTWGIHHLNRPSIGLIGITPIYMGNTGLSALGDLAGLGSPPYTWGIPYYCLPFLDHTQDHPHIHGEYGGAGGSRGGNPGSPPYTWGIHLKTSNTKASIRITPIYMGNTWIHS